MPVSAAQKDEIQQLLDVLLKATNARGKRQLAGMFLALVDRDSWPEYYEVIPEPRCLDGVKDALAKNKYKSALHVYEDLNLVFLNALYYNEEGSQIAKDAITLRTLLDTQWKQSPNLPTPPSSPPASSAQRVRKAPARVAPTSPSKTKLRLAPAPMPATPARPPPTQLPSSPDRPTSPDIDVDGGGTPEPETEGLSQEQDHGPETARDGEGDAIVRQLERGLPRWEGFADIGWAEGIPQERMVEIVLALKEFQDVNGKRVASTIEALDEKTAIAGLSFDYPLSFDMIETKAREQGYESSQAFDNEMSNLFLKARRSYEPSTDSYGDVLHLQRLYHALTSPTPPQAPFTSSTHFASLRAGPGTAKPLHSSSDVEGVPGVTTFRVSSKDRTFVESVVYKGWTVRLGDWLHLSNPDDPARPVVAQVFRCWTSEEPTKKGQPGVTACWYFRPEQTFHPAHRQFWEREVFKTSHFADHPLPDIIEKIACQFTARHIRGRPRPPYWYPSWPLYVCDSRYNDRERIFVKIKNWNSCVPEEVRKSEEFMPIYPFERIVFPRRFPSPFLSSSGSFTSLKGRVPGGIGDVVERAEGEKMEGGGIGRKRPRRNAAGQAVGVTPSRSEHTDKAGPSRGVYAGGTSQHQQQQQQQPVASGSGSVFVQPQQAGAADDDRSLVGALGGPGALGNANMERLPSETTRHFDRDPETNEVLWFAAPPVDMAHAPAPRYSLAYLHHLAKKRKLSKEPASASASVMGDVDEGVTRKKRKMTVNESVRALMVEHGLWD